MPKLGRDSKFYRNTSGNYNAPTWAEVDEISDLNLGRGWEEFDASTRGTPVGAMIKVKLNLEATGKIRVDDSDADYVAIYDAANSKDQVLDVMILNGPLSTNGVRGVRMDCQVMSLNEDQGLGTVLFDEFTLKPNNLSNNPKLVVVAGGVPTFAEFE